MNTNETLRPICVTLPPSLIARLDELARREERSRSQVVRRELARLAEEHAA